MFSFRTWQTSGCTSFNSFHINPLTVKIAVESQRQVDNEPGSVKSKFFHNKLATGIFENSKNLVAVFNPALIISILSPAGIFMGILTVVNFHKIKNPYLNLHVVYILISSVLLTLINPKIGIYNFMFSLCLFTFWSAKIISKLKPLVIFFLILIITSFWYYSLDWQMKPICNSIFFN